MSEIERDMDAFLDKGKPPMQAWFDARPELWAAVEHKCVLGEYPAMTMFLYLVDRHGFELGESTFRQMIRKRRIAARRGVAA